LDDVLDCAFVLYEFAPYVDLELRDDLLVFVRDGI
jgi:hypothetical protein